MLNFPSQRLQRSTLTHWIICSKIVFAAANSGLSQKLRLTVNTHRSSLHSNANHLAYDSSCLFVFLAKTLPQICCHHPYLITQNRQKDFPYNRSKLHFAITLTYPASALARVMFNRATSLPKNAFSPADHVLFYSKIVSNVPGRNSILKKDIRLNKIETFLLSHEGTDLVKYDYRVIQLIWKQ